LKRVPSLDEFEGWICAGDSCPEATDRERTRIVSTLVDSEGMQYTMKIRK